MTAPYPTPMCVTPPPGHKRPRHGASDARCALSDLTRDADETTQAIVRHELVATGATATAAQPHSNDAPTDPAAEQLRSPRCPEHERLFTSVCHYYADKQHPRRPLAEAIHMARRMAREWPPCSHCFQLYCEATGQPPDGYPDRPAAPIHTAAIESPAHGAESHDATAADEEGAAAGAEGATAHSEPEPTGPSALALYFSECQDYKIVQIYQRRGTVDPIGYMEVHPRDTSAVATMAAAATPGAIVVVTDLDDPPGLADVIATGTLPDHGLGGPGASEDPAMSAIVMAGQTTTVMVDNPMPPDNDAPPPQLPPPPTTPTPVPTPIPTHLHPMAPPQQPQPPATLPLRPPGTQTSAGAGGNKIVTWVTKLLPG